MALDLTTQQGALPAGGSDDFSVAPPAGTPNVDTQSKDQIATLLREANAGGTPTAAPTAPPAPEPGQDPLEQIPPDPAVPQPDPDPAAPKADNRTPEEKAADDKAAEKSENILKKFGIVDPSEAVQKMVKSYGEAETIVSQTQQAQSEVEKLRGENDHLLTMAEGFQREANELRQTPPQAAPADKMTDKEIEEYNDNPKAAIAKAVQEALKPVQARAVNQQVQNEQDKVMDFKVLSMVNKFRGDKQFDGLEADADKIMKDDNLPYTPQGVALAFHAARSVRMADIVVQAKNAAFTEGYKKHQDEVKRTVDGGRSTIPATGAQGLGGFTPEQIDKMSAAEMAQLLPNSGR